MKIHYPKALSCTDFYTPFRTVSPARAMMAGKTGEDTMWRSISLLSLFLLAGAAAAQTPNQDAPFEAATVNQFLASCGRDMSQCDFKIRLALLDKLPAPDGTSV